jgi:hypothetical protein
MVKRRLIVLGLLVLLGGGVLTLHASTQVAAHPATNLVSMQAVSSQAPAAQPSQPPDKSSDSDAAAPCATDTAGNQTGNCQNSQNTAGPEDSGSADAAGSQGNDAEQSSN